MSQITDLDHILADCFLAVGQAIGADRAVDFDTVTWCGNGVPGGTPFV